MYTFTKEDTKKLKGIAILLMIAHHLLAFPDRLWVKLPLVPLTNEWTPLMIGNYGGVCVAIFLFLGGYGTYIACKNSEESMGDFIGNKIIGLYRSYWRVGIPFVVIGFLFFRNQKRYCYEEVICHVFDDTSIWTITKNLLGFSCSYNREWWFFIVYVILLACFPAAKKIIDKLPSWLTYVVLMVIGLGARPALRVLCAPWNQTELYSTFVDLAFPYTALFWMGMLYAKEDWIQKLGCFIKRHFIGNAFVEIILLCLLIWPRMFLVGKNFELFTLPFLLVIVSDLLNRIGVLGKGMRYLGAESTNMWLIHSFFIYYYGSVAKVLLKPRYTLLVFLLVLALVYFSSMFLSFLFSLTSGRVMIEKRGK